MVIYTVSGNLKSDPPLKKMTLMKDYVPGNACNLPVSQLEEEFNTIRSRTPNVVIIRHSLEYIEKKNLVHKENTKWPGCWRGIKENKTQHEGLSYRYINSIILVISCYF